MIYYLKDGQVEATIPFSIDVIVKRGLSKQKFREEEALPTYSVTSFANRLLLRGRGWEQTLYEEGQDKERFLLKEDWKIPEHEWIDKPFTDGRCFLAQDFPRKKRKRALVRSILERFRDSIVVKAHPVHVYKGGYPTQVSRWEDLCKEIGVPYEDFPSQQIGVFAQTISIGSTAFRWAARSDNVLLSDEPLLQFCGPRYVETLEEIDNVRVISEQEKLWRIQRYSWLHKTMVFDRRNKQDMLDKIRKILDYYYHGIPLDDHSSNV